MSTDDIKNEFIPLHEVVIKTIKKALAGNLTNIGFISNIFFLYGPLKAKAPKEACKELIELMKAVAIFYESSLSDFIPYWHRQAHENLLKQFQTED